MPIDNISPTLIIKKAIMSQGIFPTRGSEGGGGAEYFGIGHIRMFGFNFVPGSHVDTNGAILSIAQNTAFFSILGTTYGGNGQTTFAAPDFATRISAGAGQGPGLSFNVLGQIDGSDIVDFEGPQLPTLRGGSAIQVDNEQQTLTVNYSINAFGIFPGQSGGGAGVPNFIGVISEFAGNFAPNDQIPCDGRLLAISAFSELFSVIGTTYGGDGVTTFAVPDMRGRNAVGTGTPPGGSDAVVLGELFGTETNGLSVANLPVAMGGSGTAVQNYGPSLGLTYLIATSGVFPSQSGGGTGENVYLGELILFAGGFAPAGFAIAQGQLLPIAQNQALFALLGTSYGGNGTTTFALPDLRGRSPANSGDFQVGTQFGSQTYTVGIDEFGQLVLNGTIGSDSYYGANQADIINGNNGDDSLFGNGGADQINGGAGADAMNGGAGNDIFTVDNAGDTVVGGADYDRVNVSVDAFDTGNDVEEVIYTGAGAFITRNGDNDNVVTGGALGDIIKSRGGNDTLNGGDGNDELNGGAGVDTMNGGEGNDTLRVDNAGDIINGGNGSDTVSIGTAITYNASVNTDVETFENTSGGNVTLTMNALDNLYAGGVGIDTVNGGGGIDNIYGYGGADLLNGDAGNDRLFGDVGDDALNGGADSDVLEGGADNDTLTGGTGDDTLYGEGGTDVLTGGAGFDTLVGGLGADRFAFVSVGDSLTLNTADRIVDFSTAQGDKIDLSAIDAITGGGDNVFTFIGTANFSNVAGQLRTEVIFGNPYAMGDTNGDGVADFFIKLDGSVPLGAGDFIL